MADKSSKHPSKPEPSTKPVRPPYEPPCMVTYTAREIMEQIGPAGACSPFCAGDCVAD